MNGLAGCYVSTIGKPHEYFDLTGIDNGFFGGKPVVDLELTIDAGGGATVTVGAQNVFNTYPDESARAMSVGEKYSEYTPWGFNGAYYYVRLGYGWGS